MKYLTIEQACKEFQITQKTLRLKIAPLQGSDDVRVIVKGKMKVWEISEAWLQGNYRRRDQANEVLAKLNALEDQNKLILALLMEKSKNPPTLLTRVRILLSSPLSRKL